MPRSNKRKSPFKPPPKHPPFKSAQEDITYLLTQEKNDMISRAISSSHKHGINLKHGSSNPGLGDCAFESVIQNNNDRICFREKYRMSPNYYRQIWVTDMANRTLNTAWNIYSSKQEWLAGWQQMLVPGTYERGIFGDLMLPGIACGIRKILLIFNTNLQSPHDPIYVVDPAKFDVQADSDIPIVLSYNLSHYESMQPCNEADILKTSQLVKDYLGGRYHFSRRDLSFLLGLDNKQLSNSNKESNVGRQITSKENFATNNAQSESINRTSEMNVINKPELKPIQLDTRKKFKSQNIDNVLERNSNNRTTKSANKKKIELDLDDEIDLEEIDEFFDSMNVNVNHQKQIQIQAKLRKRKELPEFTDFDKPLKRERLLPVNRLDTNSRIDEGGDYLEGKNRSCKNKLFYNLKKKDTRYSIKEVDGKMECPFCGILAKNVKNHFEKVIECGEKIDLKQFIQIYEEFAHAKRANQLRINTQKSEMKSKAENPETYNERKNKATKKSHAKSKDKNLKSFNAKINEATKKYEAKSKGKNLESFNSNNIKASKKSKAKSKLKDSETFDKKRNEATQKSQEKAINEDPKDFKSRQLAAVKNFRNNRKKNMNLQERLKNFNTAVLFGPIFICSCCMISGSRN